tara:strand:- start:54 stop:1421 length:1368 start_codon:yes stop_codon:yes gene_type:complete
MSKVEVNEIDKQDGSTLTLGGSGTAVTLASGATQSGFGRTGTVDWNTTPKTATFTAVSGDGFFANTTSGGFTMNLPAGVAGAIVSVADYAGTWDTGNLTVSPNGSDKIGGTNANVILDTIGQSVTFLFVDSTQGWINIQDSTSNERASNFIQATGGTITSCGNFKIHTFTGSGTFQITSLGTTTESNTLSYMVVAGGGGGGYGCSGGGGGAGGFREFKGPLDSYTASPLNGNPGGTSVVGTVNSFPITIGAGGSAGSGPTGSQATGASGANSVFSTITSAGGGGGGGSPPTGLNGGSGGGGGHSGGSGGSGNTPPVSPPQGQNGAQSSPITGPAPSDAGGGGGGATGAGIPASTSHVGGAGATTSITGSPVTRAGGGGGTNRCAGTAPDTAGGSGGGGRGGFGPRPAPVPEKTGVAGTANTGGGGGGGTASSPGTNQPGGAGGSGIVVIRYKFQG